MGDTWKIGPHWKQESHLEKWVTLEIMGNTWRHVLHFKKRGKVVKMRNLKKKKCAALAKMPPSN